MSRGEVKCSVCGRTEVPGAVCSLCLTRRDGQPRTVNASLVTTHIRRIAGLRNIDGPVIAAGPHGADCITRDTITGARWFDSATQQQCPCCGWLEVRGSFCSQCAVPTGPVDWYRPEATAGQRKGVAVRMARRASEVA